VPKSRNFSRWPVIYVYVHVEAIFQQEIIDGDIPSCHPLVEALKKDLEKSWSNVTEILMQLLAYSGANCD
jgi:hypothetical protein